MKAAAILGSIKRSGKYFQSCVRGVMKLRWDAYPRSTGKPGQNSAAKDTNDLGQGRCRKHGGATPIEKCSPDKKGKQTLREPASNATGRGRDADPSAPPAQIRTGGTTAYGSYLG